jgi:hypothetical protein
MRVEPGRVMGGRFDSKRLACAPPDAAQLAESHRYYGTRACEAGRRQRNATRKRA